PVTGAFEGRVLVHQEQGGLLLTDLLPGRLNEEFGESLVVRRHDQKRRRGVGQGGGVFGDLIRGQFLDLLERSVRNGLRQHRVRVIIELLGPRDRGGK